MKVRLHYAYENVIGQNEPVEFDAADVDELDYHLDRLAMLHGPTGLHALAEIGEAGQPASLQFGLDVGGETSGCAVLRWLPTDEFGADPAAPDLAGGATFDGSLLASAGGVLVFSAAASHVTPEQVRSAVVKYVQTGRKPGRVRWLHGSPEMAHTTA